MGAPPLVQPESHPFNIVLYPPTDVREKAIQLSRRLKKRGGVFVLGKKASYPHITLYMAEFPLKNVEKVRERLRKVASGTGPCRLSPLKFRQGKNGYVDVTFRRTPSLRKVQSRIIRLLNPLREGLVREKERAKIHQYNKPEQRNIRLYGFRSVGSRYFPHLTLTKLKRPGQSALSGIA